MMKCDECGSDMELQDTHKSYKYPAFSTVIKYYKCKGCGKEAAVER